MYEFLVLAQLSRRPMHGYLIAKIIGDIIGPYRRLQWGALYPLLARLEREGLICTDCTGCAEGDGRTRKTYAITEAGRKRLRRSLLDTEHHLGEYDVLFGLKVALFSQLRPEERLHLARHYAVYTQQNIDHLEHERDDLTTERTGLDPEQLEDILVCMDHRIEYWRSERAWAEELIERNSRKEAV